MKRIPIGIDDFKTLIEDNCYFVDKSMIIKEFWNDSKIVLITRPRRFGKSLNMSMLRYFFDDREDNRELFKGLEIYNDEEIMKLQGQFPVVYLSFRGCNGENLDITKKLVISEIRREVYKFGFLKESIKTKEDKIRFEKMMGFDDEAEIVKSINNLCEFIYAALGKKPILIIDEYDNPLNNAYVKGFYEEVIGFLKPFYENTLKGNSYLERACLTGVLRVAKESIFSGLNNLMVYSIFNEEYGDKFGFVEKEVEELFKYYNLEFDLEYVKDYYNGYTFGDLSIFNPWSIINYAKCFNKKSLRNKDFWINTSSNDIIRTLMETNADKNKKDMEKLIKGEEIIKVIDENIAYKYLINKKDAPWSLMLFSGYLKVVRELDRKRMALKIPNKEVRNIYQDVILEWVSKEYDISDYNTLVDYLLFGELEEFSEAFKDLIFSSMSFFDPSGEKPENFYHGFVLGLLALLIDTYEIKYNIKSNREAGKGRADVMIVPMDKSKNGVVLEFKKADKEEELVKEAKDALKQIHEKKYEEEMKSLGVNEVIKVGISFCGKVCEVVW